MTGTAAVVAIALAGASAHGAAAPKPTCSTSAPSITQKHTTGPLVPGRPTSLQLCRYAARSSPDSASGPLTAAKVIRSRATVDRTAALMNGLPRPRGTINCPFENGSMITVRFRYPGGTARRVTVELSGCQIVSRGSVRRFALKAPGPTLLKLLSTMTPEGIPAPS